MSGVLSVLRAGVRRLASRFIRDERGQTLFEYVMVAILVLVAVIVALVAMRNQLSNVIDKIRQALTST